MPRLTFRAHHFLCALGFQGKGYSPDFCENFREKIELLNSNDGNTPLELEVVNGLDSICAKCPNQDGASCNLEHKVIRLDQDHAATLGVKSGQIVTWTEIKQRLAERMTLKQFEEVCSPCAWKSMGACRNALQNLQKSK